MSAITDVKCVLSQKAFDAFCEKFHILEEVHLVLPNQGDTLHERPAGKIEMDFFIFFHTPDPTKVKVVERERKEDELPLLEITVGRTVPLLPVTPDRAESELEASVDKLFDDGGSGTQTGQGDFPGGGGGQGVNIQSVTETTGIVTEAVALVQPKRQRKRKNVGVDAGEPSYPPKKLREDHGTPSGASVGGKSRSSLQRLLVGAVLNAEVRGEIVPTFPFVTSFVSATPEREDGDHTDSITGHNLRTIRAPQRFVISSDSSHHSGANVAEAEVDSLVRSSAPVMTTVTTTTPMADPILVVKDKISKSSLFAADSSSAGGADPNAVYVPEWSVANGSRLDDGCVCREMVDEFAPPKFFASVRGMEHGQLFTEFNVGAARQMSLLDSSISFFSNFLRCNLIMGILARSGVELFGMVNGEK
ncbi:hypothetical protein Tco_0699447 [Tanacetum coccineum]